ncbi:MAG TPA: hypothetical protein ENI29_05875 [bacterium]|nr:hypothetical protein [bacterium]
MKNKNENLFLIHATGKDRSGLIAMLTKVVTNAGYNIIDIEQSAPHGLFYIIMIIEPTNNSIDKPIKFFEERFEEFSTGTELNISIRNFNGSPRKSSKSWLRFVFVGPDRPGLIASLSEFAGKNNANIHRMNMISRGEIIACESLLDISGLEIEKSDFVSGLKIMGEELGLQIVITSENVLSKKIRKLAIIDLDENLIQIQGLSEFFNSLEKDKETERFIQNFRDFLSTKERNSHEIKHFCISYLNGMNHELIRDIISKIIISPGTEELIRALKLMQYHIALISSSISIFTDFLKDQLDLEYAFGNAIEVSKKKLTGKFNENLEIDLKKKPKLINWLASMEKIPEAEILKFGLTPDENEKSSILSHLEDLKIYIGFDFEDLRTKIKQGELTIVQSLNLIICIGMQKSQINFIFNGFPEFKQRG